MRKWRDVGIAPYNGAADDATRAGLGPAPTQKFYVRSLTDRRRAEVVAPYRVRWMTQQRAGRVSGPYGGCGGRPAHAAMKTSRPTAWFVVRSNRRAGVVAQASLSCHFVAIHLLAPYDGAEETGKRRDGYSPS
jgi:hypothetical protein